MIIATLFVQVITKEAYGSSHDSTLQMNPPNNEIMSQVRINYLSLAYFYRHQEH
jgi:hypothetical protein